MPIDDFFPPRPDLTPTIDAGKLPAGAGLLPVGGVGRGMASAIFRGTIVKL
jgi:hypothetical protein